MVTGSNTDRFPCLLANHLQDRGVRGLGPNRASIEAVLADGMCLPHRLQEEVLVKHILLRAKFFCQLV